MKIILAFFIIFSFKAALYGQEQIAREDFINYDLQEVNFLPGRITLGEFTYEFRNGEQPVDSSSVLTVFENNGNIFVGLVKEITEFLIKAAPEEEFGIHTMHLSRSQEFHNQKDWIEVTGWLAGKQVTQPLELEITVFEPPGQAYDFTIYQGFEKVDEIKIKGSQLQFTLECFSYLVNEKKH
ncbi:hypothetical protein QQ020_34600 [Fulvivirgaceae bacterium BMA12]|uniref:Uncharacterized protein n=1 Tax=Agaribacillus aureus TaxID=3051825 RepID=A0ABT8LHH1_9BACT|nr:hypothetical protein [Fulvivirgaceae bacterium BMA12]